MLGSILSNILLVLGCCFFAGGIKYREQRFNNVVASTMSSLMVVSTASLIIPATLYAVMRKQEDAIQKDNILILSHGTAIILLLLYVLYLFFQLKTHSDFFDAEGEGEQNGEQKEDRILSPPAAGVALVLVTVLVAVCAEYLVDSIDSIVQTAHISKTFIGLVLLPIVGNAAEHVTAVVVALKNKMDLAIGVAIGSSMQIALLVTPFLVILGWIMDKPMTLHFETFETVVFFLSVLITSYVIAVGCPFSQANCSKEANNRSGWKVKLPRGCHVIGYVHYHRSRIRKSSISVASNVSLLVLTICSMYIRMISRIRDLIYCHCCQEARHSFGFPFNSLVFINSCIYTIHYCLRQRQKTRCFCSTLFAYDACPEMIGSNLISACRQAGFPNMH